MKDVFCFLIGVWLLTGIAGVIETFRPKYKINWEMVLFLIFIPFIPFVAKICGM